jgi:hypothetical protein
MNREIDSDFFPCYIYLELNIFSFKGLINPFPEEFIGLKREK